MDRPAWDRQFAETGTERNARLRQKRKLAAARREGFEEAVARERDDWAQRVESALEDYYGRTFDNEYQRLECALAALHALVEDRARSGAKEG